MTIRCAHCGEELLGAVNRCWRCGKPHVLHSGVDGLPPVRIDPSSFALAAELLPEGPAEPSAVSLPTDANEVPIALIAEASEPLNRFHLNRHSPLNTSREPSAHADAPSARTGEYHPFQNRIVRRGSPFRDAKPTRLRAASANPEATQPQDPPGGQRTNLASVAAQLSLPLAVAALVLTGILPIGGLVIACLSMSMAVWGLSSRRWLAATLGLLLGCLAFTVHVVLIAHQLDLQFNISAVWTDWFL